MVLKKIINPVIQSINNQLRWYNTLIFLNLIFQVNDDNVSARDLLFLCSSSSEQQNWIAKIRKHIPKKITNSNSGISHVIQTPNSQRNNNFQWFLLNYTIFNFNKEEFFIDKNLYWLIRLKYTWNTFMHTLKIFI